ncbi:MAG: Cof-type HAD-IIB family hydrolase [Anaerolineae bacterium]|nr:Cof-type HAD-IIB family hydrolase [Anaerolineae bacterium]
MKSDCKFLILDVDGTLIGHGAYPSQRVTDAVKAAQAKGVTVALGTGRASEACYHLLRHLDLNGLHIFFDGAAVVEWPSNEIIALRALPPRATERIIALAREYDLFLEIYAHDFYFIERDNELAQHQRQKLQLNPLITDLTSLVDRVKVVKAQLLAADDAQKKRAEIVSAQMEGYCKMAWSFDPSNGIYFANAINSSASKGSALQDLVDYIGGDISQTMTIGDSYNDLNIFEIANTKIAMGHAPDVLKELADWIAPSVNDDGVAVAIEKFILS